VIVRFALSRLSPAGTAGRLQVFIFHRVLPKADPIIPSEPDASAFDRRVSWIKSWFNVLPLDQAVDRLHAGALPARAAAITFDDGYADNATIAATILRRHGLPATVFVAPGYLDGGCMWNDLVIEAVRNCRAEQLDLTGTGMGRYPLSSVLDRRRAAGALLGQLKYLPQVERLARAESILDAAKVDRPRDLMMTSSQVKGLQESAILVGAHTMSHPILATLAPTAVRREIADSRDHLEAVIGAKVELFAYPNGNPTRDYRPADVDIVRGLGFKAAFATAWGAAGAGSDLFQLPRFTPWDRSRGRYALRLLGNYRRSVMGV
jgi:peptidoglycan/xylan/chitin deacetylase (PgdA/CDA1 family)